MFIYKFTFVCAVDKLIGNAQKKLNVLIQAVSKIEVSNDVKVQAKLFYHNIIARSMRDSYKEDAVVEGGQLVLIF